MRVDALSAEERAYLLGLYFADASLAGHGRYLMFNLQGNETPIADRVVGLFRRTGLSPSLYYKTGRKGGQILVYVPALNLLSFLPDKNEFLSLRIDNASVRSLLFAERLLSDKRVIIPFIAGLIDGDGSCKASYARRCIFGNLKVEFLFTQKKFPFLVDYVAWYVNSIARRGASIVRGTKGSRVVSINRSGREALIREGIGEWSVKVPICEREIEEVRRVISDLRSRFLTVTQAARRLGLSAGRVRGLCYRGVLRCLLICGREKSPRALSRNYSRIIPVEEVERVGERLREVERVKRGGERLVDVSRMLHIPDTTLYGWYKSGWLKAVMVRDGRSRYLVIPREEVDRLKKLRVEPSAEKRPRRLRG
jgi:hypothetical protein